MQLRKDIRVLLNISKHDDTSLETVIASWLNESIALLSDQFQSEKPEVAYSTRARALIFASFFIFKEIGGTNEFVAISKLSAQPQPDYASLLIDTLKYVIIRTQILEDRLKIVSLKTIYERIDIVRWMEQINRIPSLTANIVNFKNLFM